MKKLIAVMMAVVMFALPLTGMAEAQHLTIGMRHGSLAELLTMFMGVDDADQAVAMQQSVNDLIDCIGLDAYAQDTQAGVALTLSGSKALTMDAAFDGETVRMTSNLMGDQVVCLGLEEVVTYVRNAMGAEQFDAMLAQAQEAMTKAMTMSGDDALAGLTMENTMALITAIAGRMTMDEVTEEYTGCDQPAYVCSLTMTGADVAGLYKALVHDLLAAEQVAAYAAQLAEQQGMRLDDMVAAVDQAMDETFGAVGEIPLAIYLDAEGDLVAASTSYAVEGITFEIDYTRTTLEGIVTHTVSASAGEMMVMVLMAQLFSDGTNSYTMVVSAEDQYFTANLTTTESEGVKVARLAVTIDEEDDGFALTKMKTATETGCHIELSVELTGTAMTSMVSDPVLLTVVIDAAATADEAAIAGTDVHVLTMSEEELNQWAGSLSVSAMTTVMGAMQYLPASVMSLVQLIAQ